MPSRCGNAPSTILRSPGLLITTLGWLSQFSREHLARNELKRPTFKPNEPALQSTAADESRSGDRDSAAVT